ncbi:MAG: LVIVD repeat-containing protein [Promethearchaeota archaeon]
MGILIAISSAIITVFALLSWIKQTPVELGAFFEGGEAFNIEIDGNTAYIANWEDGLLIADISNPIKPIKLWENDSLYIRDVFISNNIAYLAAWDDGLQILDVTNPSNPQFLGNFSNGINGFSLYVIDNLAYVVGFDGLSIIDVSIPSSPIKVGQYNHTVEGGDSRGIFVSGDIAYMGCVAPDSSFKILNISDKANITKLSQVDGNAFKVKVSNNIAYIAGGNVFKIINVSDPSNPTILSQNSISAFNVYLKNEIAYLACDVWGVKLLDISNPHNPSIISTFYNKKHIYDMHPSGNLIYAVGEKMGLTIINTDPFGDDSDFDGFLDGWDPIPLNFLVPTGLILILTPILTISSYLIYKKKKSRLLELEQEQRIKEESKKRIHSELKKIPKLLKKQQFSQLKELLEHNLKEAQKWDFSEEAQDIKNRIIILDFQLSALISKEDFKDRIRREPLEIKCTNCQNNIKLTEDLYNKDNIICEKCGLEIRIK